jgi:PadR family transcriptional regulator PadR
MKIENHFINGVPELLLLRLLSRQEMYGYELVRTIRDQSKTSFSFGEGCIYPILHRLVKEDQIHERLETVQGRSRRYYRISPKGRKQLERLQQRWEEVATAVNGIGALAYV